MDRLTAHLFIHVDFRCLVQSAQQLNQLGDSAVLGGDVDGALDGGPPLVSSCLGDESALALNLAATTPCIALNHKVRPIPARAFAV